MPNHQPEAIANEFLLRRTRGTWPQQMFIQKLAYMAHGWNLAMLGEPLIGAQPEAWDNGPVYRDIWDHVKEYGWRGPHYTLLDPFSGEPFKAELLAKEKVIIDHVWRKYGSLSAGELSRMTHEPNTPWFKAYFKHRNAPLDNTDIQEHYIELAKAGRERRLQAAV